MIKNILLSLVGIMVVGIAGLAVWESQQMKKIEQQMTQQQDAPVVVVNTPVNTPSNRTVCYCS